MVLLLLFNKHNKKAQLTSKDNWAFGTLRYNFKGLIIEKSLREEAFIPN